MQKEYHGESLLENHNNDLWSGTLLTVCDTQVEINKWKKKSSLGQLFCSLGKHLLPYLRMYPDTENTLSASTPSLAHLFLIC